jgi:SAM-dependent methyltransferase
MGIFRRDLKRKWLRHAPQYWWGSGIDVRFYLIYEFQRLYGRKVLDVGCGTGIVLSEIDSSNLRVGIDISAEPLKIGKRVSPKISFIRADRENLPFKSETFDIVIATNSLPTLGGRVFAVDEIKKRDIALSEIHRVLKGDGVFSLVSMNGFRFKYHTKEGPYYATYEQTRDCLSPYFDVDIKGWDQIPSFLFFIPLRFKKLIPLRWKKYFLVPDFILEKVPFIDQLLLFLMEQPFLNKWGHYFYIIAQKNEK